MHPLEIESCLENLTLLVDTREQMTPRYRRRLDEIGLPVVRQKLNCGDYSAYVITDQGEKIDFSYAFSIERKMSLDELCQCYCDGRERFTREFERAKKSNTKMYLLIENADWEKVYAGKYRSLMNPAALCSSILAWLARYDCQILFCREETSGKLIKNIMHYEVKERLKNGIYEHSGADNRQSDDV